MASTPGRHGGQWCESEAVGKKSVDPDATSGRNLRAPAIGFDMKSYTVAQVARRTGITVRTLHHYEAEGLLVPARRSEKGYRLYGADELQRLQHVLALKALGFSLAEIRQCLATDAPGLGTALRHQIVRLREAIMRQSQLLARIEAVANAVEQGGMIDAETLLSSIEASTMMEKHFTDEQRAYFRQRREEIGAERINEMKETWRPLIPEFAKAMREKRSHADADVQILAHRWLDAVRDIRVTEDTVLKQAMKDVVEKEPAIFAERWGIDLDVFQYICAALKASRR